MGSTRLVDITQLTTDGHLKQRPEWSPDAAWLAFARHRGSTIFLYLQSADGAIERRLTERADPEFDAVWSPDGTQLAFSFDKASQNQGDIEVYTVRADGTELKLVATGGKLSHEEWPSWSPDGEWIAYTSTRDDNQELYVARPDGSAPKRLTSHPALDAHPDWSPDGTQIVFSTNRWGDLELALLDVSDQKVTRLTDSAGLDDYPTWSPDGKHIAFTSNRDGNLDIWTIEPDGSHATNLTNHPAIDNFPGWHPDGRLTFVSNRAGGFDIYIAKIAAELSR